jgi:hypothetical protein
MSRESIVGAGHFTRGREYKMRSVNRFGVMAATMIIVVVAGNLDMATAAGTTSSKKEKKLDRKDLPVAVMAAFQKTYPNDSISGASKETKDSVVYYEVESKAGTAERSILYLSDGTVSEIEEGISVDSLPASVSAGIAKHNSRGKIEKAERVTRGANVEYEVMITAGKAKTELVLDNTGTVLKTEKVSGEKDKETGEDRD